MKHDPRVAPGVVLEAADDGLVRVLPPAGWPVVKLGLHIVMRDQDGLVVTYQVIGSDGPVLLLRLAS